MAVWFWPRIRDAWQGVCSVCGGVLLATLHEALQMENAAADRVLIIIT